MDKFQVKRIYESPADSDGVRVLVDRIWPRGVSKDKARLTAWMKEIAPSTELRQWFRHEPAKFPEFKQRYLAELSADAARPQLDQLRAWAGERMVTLLYAASDEERNQAVVLHEYLTSGREAGDS